MCANKIIEEVDKLKYLPRMYDKRNESNSIIVRRWEWFSSVVGGLIDWSMSMWKKDLLTGENETKDLKFKF